MPGRNPVAEYLAAGFFSFPAKEEKTMENKSLFEGYLDYKIMKICSECSRIYGVCIDQEKFKSYYQKCDCAKPDMPSSEIKQEKWECGDFNELITLCYCCGQKVLRSGSKWGNWFCNECNKGVIDFHEKHQMWLIPIGRHSLMNRVHLNTKDTQGDRALEEFSTKMNILFVSMNKLWEWNKINIKNNLKTLEYQGDILLTDYLIQTKELPPKSQAFKEMFKFFGVPDEFIPQRPELPEIKAPCLLCEGEETVREKCHCETFKNEMPKVIEAQLLTSPNSLYSWGSSDMGYIGKLFRFCPWCGTKREDEHLARRNCQTCDEQVRSWGSRYMEKVFKFCPWCGGEVKENNFGGGIEK